MVRARTVILATGVTWRRLQIDGFDRLMGKGIYYGAARSEAGGTHGQDLFLIGAGNSAGQAALYFANHARKVTLVCRGDAVAAHRDRARCPWVRPDRRRSGQGRRVGAGGDPYLLETSISGVFACGDVRLSPVKRVAAAVGEGSMAIAFVHQYLLHEKRRERQ